MSKIACLLPLLLAIVLIGAGCNCGLEPDSTITWVAPGKVYIDGYYRGATASHVIQIHNGSSSTKQFSVTYRYPDNVDDGYGKPLPETEEWVTIEDESPKVAPYETKEIMVVLESPKVNRKPPGKFEFWINVTEQGQPGMVHIAYASRWLVTMRED